MCGELPEDQTTITWGGPDGVNTSPLSLYLEREIRARGLACKHYAISDDPGPDPPPLTAEERARYLDILARAQSNTEPIPAYDEVIVALGDLGLIRRPEWSCLADQPVALWAGDPGNNALLTQWADGTLEYFHACLRYSEDDVLRLRLPLDPPRVQTLLDRIVSDAKLGAAVVARQRARMARKGE